MLVEVIDVYFIHTTKIIFWREKVFFARTKTSFWVKKTSRELLMLSRSLSDCKSLTLMIQVTSLSVWPEASATTTMFLPIDYIVFAYVTLIAGVELWTMVAKLN